MGASLPGASLVSLLLLACLAVACEEDDADEKQASRARLAARSIGFEASARGRSGADRYFAIRGKKPTGGLAFVQTPPDTWAPFDVSFRAGFFDPEQMATADGVRVCLEVDNVGFSIFYDLCADYVGATSSWQLSAFHGAPFTPLPGSLALAADEIELRQETDGTTLRFHGRAAGDAMWTEVSSMAFPAQLEPLKAAFGAANVRKGTQIGFDDPSYASGPPPGPVTPEREVAADANQALLLELDAFQALDGDAPDFGAAETALTSAQSALADAQAGAAALPPTKITRKAGKKLAGAAKKLAKALAQTQDQNADGALASLVKAGHKQAEGVLLLVPQPPLAP
jgi:hypothetical protein